MADICAALDRHGFAIVPGFLSEAEVAAGRADFLRSYPPPEEFFAAAPEKYAWLRGGQFAGLVDFPFAGSALNDHATDPRLAALAAEVIGIDRADVRLVQARTWAKYGGNVDFAQELHRDFGSHTLAYPSNEPGLRELIAFLYYSDVTGESGPTCFLSNEHAADVSPGLVNLDRDAHAALYERETPGIGAAGTLIVYTPMTLHRGSALGPPPNYRWVLGVSFRAAGLEWMGNQSWPGQAVKDEMAVFLTRATPEQRSLLGFPPPGHRYWTPATLAGVAARYPGIDLSPYKASG